MANQKTAKEIVNSIVVAMLVVILVVISGLVVASITESSVFNDLTASYTITNETGGFINTTGYTLDQASATGFTSPVITGLFNATDDTVIGLGNVSVTNAGVMTNATATLWEDVLVSYTYTASTGRNAAGINITAISDTFGEFVTNLIAFLAIIGTIVGVVWLVLYVKKLFDKKTGLSDITA